MKEKKLKMDRRSVCSAMDELCIGENGQIGRTRLNNKGGSGEPYKSKNLFAERNRREKLHNKLMELRGLVPLITNMKKATIIEDAIAHIQSLEETMNDLKNQLCEVEAFSEDRTELSNGQIYDEEPINEPQIQLDISVARICENKLWIKVAFEKKFGSFTRLMEALSTLGLEATDTSLTTSDESMLVVSCVEGYPFESLAVQEMKELLVEIVKGHLI